MPLDTPDGFRLPAGFREDTGSGSGLIVPEALSRKREVITQAEWKKIRGAIEHVCKPHNLKFVWMCNAEHCPDPMMRRVRTAHGFYLQCGCRELHYDPKI